MGEFKVGIRCASNANMREFDNGNDIGPVQKRLARKQIAVEVCQACWRRLSQAPRPFCGQEGAAKNDRRYAFFYCFSSKLNLTDIL